MAGDPPQISVACETIRAGRAHSALGSHWSDAATAPAARQVPIGRCCLMRPIFSTRYLAPAMPIRCSAFSGWREIFEQTKNVDSLGEQLAEYERQLFREITFLDWLVHGCYRTFGRFDLLSAYVMYYFAGAVESETRFRNGAAQTGFLFSDFEPFRSAVKHSYNALVRPATPAAVPLPSCSHRSQAILLNSTRPGFATLRRTTCIRSYELAAPHSRSSSYVCEVAATRGQRYNSSSHSPPTVGS